MELLYFGVIGFCFLLAVSNWRAGIYACLVLDVVRDPVRKLVAGHSVWITVAVGLVWFGVFLGVLSQHRSVLRHALRQYAQIRRAILLVVVALLPGAALAVILYPSGYRLAIIGGISYLAPFMGIAIGYCFAKSEKSVEHLMRFYTILNSIALMGTMLQFMGTEHAMLGGIDMDWIRHHGATQVHLLAGLYRSPDIMGLHAAHVTVFGMILAIRAKSGGRIGWGSLAGWGFVCLILAGRRKMLAIPFVFMLVYLGLGAWRGARFITKSSAFVAIVCAVCAGGLLATRELEGSHEYTAYASTLLTSGVTRANELVTGSIRSTLYQSGVLGSGLGSATQGAQYAGISGRRAWQEDGASRLLKELGIPGVLLMAIAAILFARSVIDALRRVPPPTAVQRLQIALLSVVMGNVASFIASHQQYSGDPATSLFVLLLLGAVFAMPNVFHTQTTFQPSQQYQPGQSFATRRKSTTA